MALSAGLTTSDSQELTFKGHPVNRFCSPDSETLRKLECSGRLFRVNKKISCSEIIENMVEFVVGKTDELLNIERISPHTTGLCPNGEVEEIGGTGLYEAPLYIIAREGVRKLPGCQRVRGNVKKLLFYPG